MGFGARLREERLKTGLNQEEFGRIGGVGRNSQNEYESDKTPPKADYLIRLGEYGADVAYVLTGNRATDTLSAAESELIAKLRKVPSRWTAVCVSIADAAHPIDEPPLPGHGPELGMRPD